MKIKTNRTQVYFRRIPNDPELVKLMDSAILDAAKESFKVAEWLKREYGVVYGDVVPNNEAGLIKIAVKADDRDFQVAQLRAENLILRAKVKEYEQMYG